MDCAPTPRRKRTTAQVGPATPTPVTSNVPQIKREREEDDDCYIVAVVPIKRQRIEQPLGRGLLDHLFEPATIVEEQHDWSYEEERIRRKKMTKWERRYEEEVNGYYQPRHQVAHELRYPAYEIPPLSNDGMPSHIPKHSAMTLSATHRAPRWTPPTIHRIPKLKHGEREIRLRPYHRKSSAWYEEALYRATTQRLFMIERTRTFESSCHANHRNCPVEIVRIAGTTGNVYTVYISHVPTCTCPDHRYRDRSCKHISYVLHHVLKAPAHLCYQDAFLTSELHEIAGTAPPSLQQVEVIAEDVSNVTRKPIEDDCPICCQEFEEETEHIVWCQSSCGNNVHKNCLEQWSKARASRGQEVTCPLCRTPWQTGKAPIRRRAKATAGIAVGPSHHHAEGSPSVRVQLGYH